MTKLEWMSAIAARTVGYIMGGFEELKIGCRVLGPEMVKFYEWATSFWAPIAGDDRIWKCLLL